MHVKQRTQVGHSRWVWGVVFSVDAAYLGTASFGAVACLQDLLSGAQCCHIVD